MKKILICLVTIFITITGLQSQDMDGDGLLDTWEMSGRGPINPSVHRLRTDHADMYVMFAFRDRSAVDLEEVNRNIAKVKEFYRSVPLRNPDGTIGINIVVLWGNNVPPSDATTTYYDLYNQICPEQWRCYAHVYLIEPGIGGAGQNLGKIAAGGYSWQIIAHELGHQLGLGHSAPGSENSPLFPSLMNYDFSYSLGGNAEAIKFSTGQFSSCRLNESNLNETVPFPYADVLYLSASPYFYTVERVDDRNTSIDWNRNGTCCERNVRADINDGVFVKVGPTQHLDYTSSSICMNVIDDKLIMLFSKILPTNTLSWNTNFDNTKRHSLHYQIINNRNEAGRLKFGSIEDVYGDLSSITTGVNKLLVAFPTAGSHPKIIQYELRSGSSSLLRLGEIVQPTINADQYSLAGNFDPSLKSPGDFRYFTKTGVPIKKPTVSNNLAGIWMFSWSKLSNQIFYYKVGFDNGSNVTLSDPKQLKESTLTNMTSTSPIGVIYDKNIEQMIVVTKGQFGGTQNRLKVNYFKIINNEWVFVSSEWIGLPNSSVSSLTAPSLLIEPSGSLTLYVKGSVPLDENAQVFRIRKVSNRVFDGGWITRKIRDDWTTTRSSPAVCAWQNDVALAMRWCLPVDSYAQEMNNRIVYISKASGISNIPLRDFDEVSYIKNNGLRNFICR